MRARVGVVGVLLVVVLAASPAGSTTPNNPLTNPNAYPRRGVSAIKGLQPDFWPKPSDNEPGLGTVAVNFFWPEWEPTVVAPPCPAAMVEFEGHCFDVPTAPDGQVKAYFDLGVPVTAILYGTPAWARGTRPCSPVAPGYEVFCVPDHPADYARFVGLIASRYDGAHGFGRVSDFVIQNEVNSNDWFDIGCGQGVPCPPATWIADYASIYDAAYDSIVAAQPQGRVLISFEHDFAPVLDDPTATHPGLSVQTFLRALAPKLGDRQWSVAIHPYPIFANSEIDARDYPYVTLGNIGVLVGWLREAFPDRPRAWQVEITEVGLNDPGTVDALQRMSLCTAFENVLGTPGVTSFIYHRLVDNPNESGLALGLRHADGTPKPAWYLWHSVNSPTDPKCGFQDPPFTVVQHGVDPADGANWYSSRVLPKGYVATGESWALHYVELPGDVMLYECAVRNDSYLTRDVGCEGNLPLGPVGSASLKPGPGLAGLYHCAGPSDLVGTDAACPGGRSELLGYVHVRSRAAPTTTTTTTTVPSTVPQAPPAQPERQPAAFTG